MKRIILLLLVISCFRISYGEELSAEQQQLAWKFMYDNMLSKEYLPTIFRENITINLKGEITSEDSIVVKDLIQDFQKAIPHLKIELSNKPGNLVYGLNDGKKNRVTTNTSANHTISSKEMYFPTEIYFPSYQTLSHRKKFIYYDLFRGLLSYSNNKKDILGMDGCVFTEGNANKISYSPFDLFIIEKLYAPDFQTQLLKNLPPEVQETAWSSIRTTFLGETKKPIIYRDDIAIKWEGMTNHVDSACMNELISQLSLIIPNRKFYLTSGNANIFISIPMPSNISKEETKRILYYYLIKPLVTLSPSLTEHRVIMGSVFYEKQPEDISFLPIDAFILNKLYADDFHERFKAQFPSNRLYLVHRHHNELNFIFFLLGWLAPAIFLIRLIIRGVFKPHNWNWIEYNKQGIYVITTYCLYLLISSASDLYIDFRFQIVLISFLQALLAVNLIFFTERFILLRQGNLGGSKVIVIFLITLIILTITSYLFWKLYKTYSEYVEYSITTKLPILHIFLFSLARSLYIFLNDRYKSIINQKDVELAQMSELHKQAELQSLRAKINPHFLYNALNSIASLATTDGRKTEQMALSLSDFFKYAINREQKQLNTLAEELNATRTYLEIEKVRFGDRLSFEIDCPTELLDIQIPQLLIQPLVENAIKHGLSQITEKGLIRIAVSKSANQLKIRVYDNGPAFFDGPLTGFGIQNTQERIALLYGQKATINWQNGEEKFIEISLPMDL